ncbi:hypothetical protein ACFL1K_01655, partial [Candidatus Omnitrophota bacterium]
LANCVKYIYSPWLWLLLLYILLKERQNLKMFLYSLLTALAVFGIVLLPFYFKAGPKFLSCMIWQLIQQSVGTEGLAAVLYLFPVIQTYFPFYLILGSFFIYYWLIRDKKKSLSDYLKQPEFIFLLSLFVVSGIFAYTFLIRIAPVPFHAINYFPYLVLLSAVASAKLIKGLNEKKSRQLFTIILALLIFFTPFLQPRTWQLFNLGWQRREVRSVYEVAGKIKAYTQKDALVFTFSPIFAAQADRKVLKGMEFDAYGYHPDWPDSFCQTFGFLNTQMLIDRLDNKDAGILVLSQDRFFRPLHRAQLIEKDLGVLRDAIDRNYRVEEKLSFPRIYLGDVYIYLPRD